MQLAYKEKKNMNLELSKVDPKNCSIEQLKDEIKRLGLIKDEYYNKQLAIKEFINSIYGACASPYFVGYNIYVAEAVTLQGQDIIFFTNRILDEYFLEQWHLDVETHKDLGVGNVKKIQNKTMIIYNDTDSIFSSSIIKTDLGDISAEDLYNKNTENGSNGITVSGHESVKTSDKVLNWSDDKKLYYAPIKRIIRHKVSKSKWKLKTKSGKEVIVTNDHSMIVFRKNEKIEVKPCDVLETDKILCVK